MQLHALDDQGLQWFEEPIQFDDLEGSAQLARAEDADPDDGDGAGASAQFR